MGKREASLGNAWAEQLKIDRHALDAELVQQPQLFWQVSEAHVNAVSRRDAQKEIVERTRAGCSLAIRGRALEEGRKTTEGCIEAEMSMDQEVIDVTDAYLSMCAEADRLHALKEAFNQRAYVLRDLAGLFVAGYFSNSAVKGKGTDDTRNMLYEQQKKQRAARREGKS